MRMQLGLLLPAHPHLHLWLLLLALSVFVRVERLETLRVISHYLYLGCLKL